MNKTVHKFIIVAISVIILGIGISLALKVAIGVGAWDALSQSISGVTNIKVGTIAMTLNISCVLIQLILLKKEFKIKQVLQILVAILLGIVVNFVLYEVFSNFTINNYFIKIIILLVAYVICAISVSVIMAVDFVTLPLESCCMVISTRTTKKFGALRQFVDIISIIIAVGISFIFNQSLAVREGTIIGMIIFGPMLDFFMKIIMPTLKKLELVN
jgi:uncharacterized membrane protein YczE